MTTWSEWIAEKTLRAWLEEHCEFRAEYVMRLEDLAKAFNEPGRPVISLHTLGRALRVLGYDSARVGSGAGGRVWLGLRLKNSA